MTNPITAGSVVLHRHTLDEGRVEHVHNTPYGAEATVRWNDGETAELFVSELVLASGSEQPSMTRQEAVDRGIEDGIEDVRCVLAEQGMDVIRATLRPSHVGWDEGAIIAGAAHISGVPEELEETYYAVYAKAARMYAQLIVAAEDGEVP